MAKKGLTNIEDAVKVVMSDYVAIVNDEMREILSDVAKDAVKKVKETAPSKTGAYAKGWTATEDQRRLTSDWVVHGKVKHTWALAHLLENGHATRNGGRVDGIKHLEPVQEWVNEEIERRLSEL